MWPVRQRWCDPHVTRLVHRPVEMKYNPLNTLQLEAGNNVIIRRSTPVYVSMDSRDSIEREGKGLSILIFTSQALKLSL